MIGLIILAITIGGIVGDDEDNCKSETVFLTGAGSSSAASFYTELGAMYSAKRTHEGQQISFNYQSSSSGYGLDRITMRVPGQPPILFAASETPLGNSNENQHMNTFPMIAGAILIIYHVPEVKRGHLVMSGKVLAKIYSGQINYWDHPEIQEQNKAINLTHNKISIVARHGESGTTFVLTSGLSEFDPQWQAKYGSFSNNNFIGDICCNSSSWPADTISVYAKGSNGMMGVVGSIPYSLGYASEANVFHNTDVDVKFAKLVNAASHVTEPNETSVQAAIDYHLSLSQTNGSIVFDLNNAAAPKAYPLASFSYMVINISTHSQIFCCQMQELSGFIEFLLKSKSTLFRKHRLVSLSPRMVSTVMQNIVQKIQCKGKPMYSQYRSSLEPRFTFQVWHGIIIALSVMVIILLVAMIIRSIKTRKNNEAAIKKWLLTGHVVFKTGVSMVSLQPNENVDGPRKFLCKVGELDGNDVLLDALKINKRPKEWSGATKALVTHLKNDISHPNIVNLVGMAEIEQVNYALIDYTSKGNLYYVLQTCRYDLSDSIKYNMVLNAAQGLAFLHRKHIIHGQLNSINCYVDGSWTFKIGGWYRFSIINTEGHPQDMENEFKMNYSSLCNMIKAFYMDPDFMGFKSSASDIYSFGLLIVEIFTKSLPFGELPENFIEWKLYKSESVMKSLLNLEELKVDLQPVVSSCIGGMDGRPRASYLCAKIKKLKPTSKGIVDEMMETMEEYANNLEKMVDHRTMELSAMTEQMRGLLDEVLPHEIATALLNGEQVAPEFFECVTICFTDIVGFTDISKRSKPTEVMRMLNDLWVLFDSIAHRFDVYKVDTIGDAYMVCSGLPKRNNNEHSKNIADLALALLDAVANFSIQHMPKEKLCIRCGVNSGAATAGIVGTKMPQYCVFGDAVNTASRMESTSKPMKIQLSSNTVELLDMHYPKMYILQLRGNVEVKGKGEMETYWLMNKSQSGPYA